MITKDIPEPVVPYYVGTDRLDEPADTRKRSWERVESHPYPDSEESEDDVVYAEECEYELQQINLRKEVTNQITVDTCGERCAQLDDFNWFLLTDEWNEKSDTPESEIDTSDSGNGVQVNALDSSSPETETTTQQLLLRRDLKGAVSQQCPDNLQIEMSATLVKMADGSPPAEVKILTDSDTLQTELSVMTVKSERWMERFIMNPQVLCLDGLTSDDDPEDRSSDVDGEDGVFQDPIPTVVSVRPEVTEKWMDRFVVDLVECPSVSRTSAVARRSLRSVCPAC